MRPSWEGPLGKLRGRPWLAALIILVCLVVILAGGTALSLHAWAGHHWRQAQQALRHRDFSTARSHLSSCLQVWPRSAETHFYLARACRRQGDLEAARRHLAQAEDLGWNTDATDLEYILLQTQTGVVRPVETTLQAYLRSGHSDEELILEAMVSGYLQSYRLDAAYHWACVWIEKRPDDGRGHERRGQVLERGFKFALAAKDYEQALDRRPDDAYVRWRLAEMLFRTGRFPQALAHFEQYRGRRPDDVEGVIGVGRCLRSLGDSDAALNEVQRWIAAYGERDHAALYLLQGQLHCDLNRPETARELLRQAHALAPNDVDTNQSLALLLREIGQPAEADKFEKNKDRLENDLRRLEELTRQAIDKPSELSLRLEAGRILLGLNQCEEAGRWLLSGLQESPDDPELNRLVSELYNKLGDPVLADRYRQKGLVAPLSP